MELPSNPKHRPLQPLSEEFVRESFLSDDVLDFVKENTLPFDTMMTYYQCAIMEVETKFRVLNAQFSLQYERNPIENITSRVKSVDSLIRKVRDKKIPLSFTSLEENINDIAGVRVICSFPDDIYFLADCFLQQDDITLLERKDYIKNPKPSGYRSLHLIVQVPIFLQNEKRNMKVEVQLRTIAMDFWASLEHKLRYKKNMPPKEAEQLARELEDCAKISAELDLRMQAVRSRINEATQKETPKSSNLPLFRLPFSKSGK